MSSCHVLASAASACCLLAAAQACAAESAPRAFERWGLLGVWKITCDETSPKNIAFVFAIKNGRLGLTRDFGTKTEAAVVTNATIEPDDSIKASTEYPGAARQQWTIVRDGNRYRTITNYIPSTNSYTIKDGVITSSGKPSAWLVKCE